MTQQKQPRIVFVGELSLMAYVPHGTTGLRVLWNANDVIPGSLETIKGLKALGKKIFYVTNNSTKSRAEYAQKCIKLGFPATEDEIVCTSYISALYLHNMNFKGKIYVMGNPSMGAELDRFGLKHTGIGPDPPDEDQGALQAVPGLNLDPEINCVLVGFDKYISYPKIMKAASYARQEGALFLATNEDTHLPMDVPYVVPGTGSIVASVKVPARKEPIVMGKPEINMFKCLQEAHNLDPSRCMMVGDRCNTDISMATNCGMKSLLVLSGVSTLSDVEEYKASGDLVQSTYVPTYYTSKLGQLGKLLGFSIS
ncbi:glycerol-3-phosphate phosphatase-like isoform X2 [Ostrea edulis]|uniref:glycerol-3-phosphate phosphatase-like isoform X2 n=1 Tax=Ostrea edulis TaxID=37623 RepID=UPI0024AEDF18|nr:glycerol-3-phosphate phosphatase-like isoform X2 [Ostrea edulis]